MSGNKTIILYRPVGPKELELIAASGYREFPPRLPDQPIFYPVLNEDYARQIAREWNVPASGAGYVTDLQFGKNLLAGIRFKQWAAQSTRNCGFHRRIWPR